MERERKNSVVKFKIAQAIFLGLFALGISMSLGDVSVAVQSPISSLSIVTTIFGLIGVVITEIFSRKAEKW